MSPECDGAYGLNIVQLIDHEVMCFLKVVCLPVGFNKLITDLGP